MVEANLGQLADLAASSQQVKDYAQMLVSDHTNDFQKLSGVANQANLTMPTAIDSAHNKMMIDPFQKLKDAAFDKKYVHEMVAGHTKAIAMYKKKAASGDNADLKSYAEQALPTLQKHLDAAKALKRLSNDLCSRLFNPILSTSAAQFIARRIGETLFRETSPATIRLERRSEAFTAPSKEFNGRHPA